MTIGSQIAWDDTVLPFQLDASGIRGRVARLDGVLDQVLKQHAYPSVIEALVAETALLTALIGQAVDLNANPFSQIGEGYFAVMLDQGEGMVPYQGFTPIAGKSLSDCAETYFAQSEQIPTRFALAYGESAEPGRPLHWRAGGIMLQHMPAVGGVAADQGSGEGGLLTHADILGGADSEDWNRANLLLDTVEELEMIGPSVPPTDLLVRLFHEEGPRVFDAQPVRFGCSCSEQKVRSTMSIYSQKDISKMTTEAGIVTADCQFCGAHYEMDPKTLGFEGTDAKAAAAAKGTE